MKLKRKSAKQSQDDKDGHALKLSYSSLFGDLDPQYTGLQMSRLASLTPSVLPAKWLAVSLVINALPKIYFNGRIDGYSGLPELQQELTAQMDLTQNWPR